MEIDELSSTLKKYKEAYYNDAPIVSDEEFDALEDELRNLDPENEYFSLVGASSIGENKRKHKIAMGSQSKVKIDEDGINKVIEQFFRKGQVVYSRKMDGISVAVEYKNGKFQNATTRGDGFVGDDIPNATEFINIPETIDDEHYNNIEFTARGELYISYEDFELINSKLPDEEKFSNPRNATAGIARKEDSPFRQYITVKYYDIVTDDIKFTYKHEKLGLLGDIFDVCSVVWYDMDSNEKLFRIEAEKMNTERKTLPYMIDGLVIEFDDLAYFDSLGVANGNKPRGSVALKFNAVAETTHVTDVVWQVGSTGNLTPVVEFEPTLIDGSVVRRASIHNYDIFNEWGFGLGDTIEVQKNNDIIPQVKSVVERSINDRYVPPTRCPSCDSELEYIKVAKTINLVCVNTKCPAKYIGNIKKWAVKSGMTSKGVGDAFFEAYAESPTFTGVEDLYKLSIDDIMNLSDRYRDKSATNIYNAIQSSKTMKLMDFFGGLNIYGSGSRTFKKIIDATGLTTVNDLTEYILNNSLIDIDGIGDITANNIINGVDELKDTIRELDGIITIESETKPNTDGMSFLFTGAFNTIDPNTGKGYKRNALEALVASKGHTVASTVNSDLKYLVTSDTDSTSSKMTKAKKLGVRIIGEDEFFNIIGG